MWHRSGSRLTALFTSAAVIALAATLAPADTAVAGVSKAHHPRPPKTVYAVSFAPNSTLYRLNPRAKTAKPKGDTGVQMTDIAFRGKALYGVSFTALYQINVKTGAAQQIGSLSPVSTANALVTSPSTKSLYGADQQGDFFSIDTGTGQPTLIGDFGNGIGCAGDLTFAHGHLYATVVQGRSKLASLARISLHTGLATIIGDTGKKNLWGLATGGGRLYGATHAGTFVSISPKTGKAKVIWKDGLAIGGLATPTP